MKKVVRPGRGENHGGKAKELLGGLKKMIETKLGNTKVKGFGLDLIGDFAVIVNALHNKVGISKVLLDKAYAIGLEVAPEEDKLERTAEIGAKLIAESILNAWETCGDDEDDGEKPEEPKESRPCCSECGEPIDSLYSYYIDGAYLCEECMNDRYMVKTPVER